MGEQSDRSDLVHAGQGLALASNLTVNITRFYDAVPPRLRPHMIRPLHDGVHWLEIWPLFEGEAELSICRFAHPEGGIDKVDYWEYGDQVQAVVALRDWEDVSEIVYQAGVTLPTYEPSGWVHHPPSKRRRPHGDLAREYVGD